MPQGLGAELAGADADPSARQILPVGETRRRRRAPFVAIGAAAFLVALIAELPARFVVSPGSRWAVAGTVWNGEAVLDGAYRLQWRWAPWRSLASLAFAADIRLDGGGTDIAGSATRVGGGYLFEGLSGRGDGGLLGTLATALPVACDAPLQIDMPRLLVAGARSSAAGEIRMEPGVCRGIAAPAGVAIPALLASATRSPDGGTILTVTPAGQGRLRLMEGGIAGGRLRLALTRAGVVALPFARGLAIDEAL